MAHSSSSSVRRQHDGSLSSRSYVDSNEWESKESLQLKELEEARARAAQMEKTMKWWSDCTANWREKWSKVRNERNKSREEAKHLRSKLEASLKDLNTYKREKQDLEVQNEHMRKELERIHLLLLQHAGQWDNQLIEALDNGETNEPTVHSVDDKERPNSSAGNSISSSVSQKFENISINSPEKQNGEQNDKSSPLSPQTDSPPTDSCANCQTIITCPKKELPNKETEVLKKNVTSLQQKLDASLKVIENEKEEKLILEGKVSGLELELKEIRTKCDELRAAREEAVKELLEVQVEHADTVAHIRADLLDETHSRQGMDRRLTDLRAQIERLQAENATEWGKRERLESDKVALEKEAKRLRSELMDAVDRLERRSRVATTSSSSELCSSASSSSYLHQEIANRNKELCDIKHAHNKLKKVLTDKTTELAHVMRRCEQYEGEVRKLRCRIEELKRELALAEDEVDSATDNLRKLQRTNDELQEQLESLQVQMDSMNTRSGVSSSSSLNHTDTNNVDEDTI